MSSVQEEILYFLTLHLLQMFLANMHEYYKENQQELKELKTWDIVLVQLTAI